MLMRTDPFRELDRLTQQVLGTAARPAVMPMDAWRDQDTFIVAFDLPGVSPDSIQLDIDRNVLNVKADRSLPDGGEELVAAERPRGVFTRQVLVGDSLDTDRLEADYTAGVLTLRIPVAEKAKPRKITISSGADNGRDNGHRVIQHDADEPQQAINA
jgi:HSP20 family protein